MKRESKKQKDAVNGPSRRRGPLARVETIRQAIASGAYPNCSTLSRELEVGVRTIKRDMEFMRDRLRLEIGFDTRRNGFFFREEGTGKVSQVEIFALMVAHKVIQQYRGTPVYAPLEVAFRKMTGHLDNGSQVTSKSFSEIVSVRPFAPEDADVRTMELVSQAVCSRRAIRFHYRKPGEAQGEERQVQPFHLMEFDARWYVIGHDRKREAVRTFALGRMSAPELTKERFERPRDFDPREHLAKSVGIMCGEADYRVVIEMDPWLTDMFRGRKFNNSQEWTELASGGSVLRVRVACLEEIRRWVMGWGTHANVLEPEALRMSLAETGRALGERYGGNGE